MVNSEKAGVMFTINPNTNNMDEILIEAGFGLGEYVVLGRINPDLYILDKKTLKLKMKNIPNKKLKLIRDVNTGENVEKKIPENEQKLQVLTEYEIDTLGHLAITIENHYKKPQDH